MNSAGFRKALEQEQWFAEGLRESEGELRMRISEAVRRSGFPILDVLAQASFVDTVLDPIPQPDLFTE